jgi:hypothetical protein
MGGRALSVGSKAGMTAHRAGSSSSRRQRKPRRWLLRNPRLHLAFTPTSASWLNLVERFFAEITRQAHPPLPRSRR